MLLIVFIGHTCVIHAANKDAVRIEPWIHLLELLEAGEKHTCSNQKHKGQRNLGDYEEAAEPLLFNRGRYAPSAFVQVQPLLRESLFDCGSHSSDQTGEEADASSEEQDSRRGADNVSLCKAMRDNPQQQPSEDGSQQEAKSSCNSAEDDRLRHKLLD